MTRLLLASAAAIAGLGLLPGPVCAQGIGMVPVESALPALPPATKLEAFIPAPGSLVTLGYDDLGAVTSSAGGHITADVREVRDAQGHFVRGLVVEVTESPERKDRAFVDEDEVSQLLAGVDALLNVRTNPTAFKKFEVTYRTRGDLEVTALNTGRDDVLYSVAAGRTVRAQVSALRVGDLQKLRAMLDSAAQKLAWLAAPR